MANADGQVRIKIEDNALKVAANLSKLQDRFSALSNDVTKYERILAKVEGTENAKLPIYDKIRQKLEEQKEAIKQATNEYKKLADIQKSGLGYNQLNSLTQTAIERLRNLALQGRTNSVEFKELANTIKNSNKQIKDADSAVEKATQDFKDFSIAGINVSNALKAISAVAIVKTLSDIGQQAIKTAGEFEQLETSFKIMAGGAEQGEKLTKSLINLASKTPMTTSGLAKASQTLLSFGESAENIIDDLKLLGDISGGEEQRFQSLALAFAQVGSTGRLTGQDLLQMVNQGFNPLQAISEKTGKSMAQLKKEMGEGKISFDMVKQAMADATSEGGRFFGLMEEQSQTLSGKLSTLNDNWDLVNKSIGDKFLPYVKDATDELINLSQNIQNPLNMHIDILNDNIRLLGEGLKGIRDLIGALLPGTNNLSKAFTVLNTNAAKLGLTLQYALAPLQILQKGKTLKDVIWEYQKITAKWKGLDDELIRQFNGKKNPLDFSATITTTTETKTKNTNKNGGFGGGNGSGNSSGGSTSSNVQKIKDAFEKAQEKAQEAEKAFKLALYKYGEGSQQVDIARKKWEDTKKAVDDVQKAYEKLTASGKTPFEQLNFNLQEAQKKLQNLASADVVDLEKIRQAQTELQQWQSRIDTVNSYLQVPKTKLEELNIKIQETERLLQDLYFTKGVNSDEFIKAKNELAAYQVEAKNFNTAITSRVGLDWENVSKSIKSNLSSAILTPLQEGESAFNRLATIGLNAVQLVGQEIIKNLLEQITLEKTLTAIRAAGKAVGSFFGLTFADGGVFKNGNVIPFARGGVVNQPTVFPMANGGTGLMGEAGAEAVMPLRRMNNGKLGVEADNSGNAVQVNIYNQSNSEIETRKRNDGSMDIIIKKVNEALMNERTSSGFRAAYQREDRKGLQAV